MTRVQKKEMLQQRENVKEYNITNKQKNLRELSQPQEKFAPKFKRNQEKICLRFSSFSDIFFIYFYF